MIALSDLSTNNPVALLAQVLPLIATLVFLIKKRFQRVKDSISIPLTLMAYTAFVAYRILSITISPTPQLSVSTLLNDGYSLMAFFYILLLLKSGLPEKAFEDSLLWITAIFAIANLPSLIQWWLDWVHFQGNPLSVPLFAFRLPGAFLSHPNIEAAFINLAIPLAVVRLVLAENRRRRAGYTLLIVSLFSIQFFASSRGAWISVGLSLLVTLAAVWYARVGTVQGMVTDARRHLKPSTIIKFLLIVLPATYVLSRLLSWQSQHPTHTALATSRSGLWKIGIDLIKVSPVLGHGPGSFHFLSVAGARIPPGFYLVHAHNLILQIAAEIGIPGLLLAVCLGLLATRAWIKAWRQASRQKRYLLAAYGGGLLTALSHSMVDFPFEALIYTLAVLMLVALIEQNNLDSKALKITSNQILLVLLVSAGLYAGLKAWRIRGYRAYEKGLEAAAGGHWDLASDDICRARNEKPDDSFYHFECALALSHRYENSDDPAFLASAIGEYQDALASDPYWPVHWANLAVLEFASGEKNQAVLDMTTAREATSRNSRFAVTLGWMYEQAGQLEEARLYYQQALLDDPWIARSAFFNDPLVSRVDRALINTLEFRSEAERLTFQGWAALDSDQLDRAKDFFLGAIADNAYQAEAQAGLALVSELDGSDKTITDSEMRIARFYAPRSELVQYASSVIAFHRENFEDSAAQLMGLFLSIAESNLSHEYYASTYRRPSLASDTVPQMPALPLPRMIMDQFQWLADYFGETGRKTDSGAIRRWLSYQPGT